MAKLMPEAMTKRVKAWMKESKKKYGDIAATLNTKMYMDAAHAGVSERVVDNYINHRTIVPTEILAAIRDLVDPKNPTFVAVPVPVKAVDFGLTPVELVLNIAKAISALPVEGENILTNLIEFRLGSSEGSVRQIVAAMQAIPTIEEILTSV